MLLARSMGSTSTTVDVTTWSTTLTGSSTTNKSGTYPGTGTLSGGRLLVVVVCWSGTSGCTLSSMSDSVGNTYVVVSQTTSAGGTFPGVAIAYSATTRPIVRGTTTFTCTMSSAVTIFAAAWHSWELLRTTTPPNVTAHGSATGNSTAVAISSAAGVNVAGTRMASVFGACWTSTNTGTAGGSYTETYDGAVSTSRYYAARRFDLAPGTALAPAATIATAATDWAAVSVSWSQYRANRREAPTPRQSRPAVTTSARF